VDDQNPVGAAMKMRHIADTTPEDGRTIDNLIDCLEHDGLLIAMMMLTLPFLLPVSIPGLSTPLGVVIVVLAISLMINKRIPLPSFLGNRRIKQSHIQSIALFAAKLLAKIESWSKPRFRHFSTSHGARIFHLGGIIVNALCLFLPLPLPFSNFIPAYGIVMLSFGILRKDGLLIVYGHTLLVLAVAYFATAAVVSFFGIQSLGVLDFF
jgi:hypothetical protein